MNKLILCCAAFLILSSACTKTNKKTKNSVQLARVNNHYLTLNEARRAIPAFVLQQDSTKALKNYRREWINRKLLLQKAVDLNVANQPAIQRRLQHAREQVLTNAVRKVILTKFEKENKINNKEALQYYKNHKEQFALKERYIRFRHLSIGRIENARLARQALASGDSWTKVAEQYSKKSKQRIRQSQKYWPVSVVLNEFPTLEQYIASMDSSEISPVRQINGAYHFVQLTGTRAKGEYADPAWILDQVKKWIILEKKNQFFNSYVKNLYLEAKEHNEIEFYNVLQAND